MEGNTKEEEEEANNYWQCLREQQVTNAAHLKFQSLQSDQM